jgi:hypothetical protein
MQKGELYGYYGAVGFSDFDDASRNGDTLALFALCE